MAQEPPPPADDAEAAAAALASSLQRYASRGEIAVPHPFTAETVAAVLTQTAAALPTLDAVFEQVRPAATGFNQFRMDVLQDLEAYVAASEPTRRCLGLRPTTAAYVSAFLAATRPSDPPPDESTVRRQRTIRRLKFD